MTAEQALAAAKIIREIAADREGWGYYPLAEALEEYVRQIIAKEAGRMEAARREAFDDLIGQDDE